MAFWMYDDLDAGMLLFEIPDVRRLNERGTTVLLTTHYLEEAEELCDRIAIIDRGKVVACEPKETLLARIDAKELTVHLGADIAAVPAALIPGGG